MWKQRWVDSPKVTRLVRGRARAKTLVCWLLKSYTLKCSRQRKGGAGEANLLYHQIGGELTWAEGGFSRESTRFGLDTRPGQLRWWALVTYESCDSNRWPWEFASCRGGELVEPYCLLHPPNTHPWAPERSQHHPALDPPSWEGRCKGIEQA